MLKDAWALVAYRQSLGSCALEVINPDFMIAGSQVDCARAFAQRVCAAILDNHCVVDPQPAAVVRGCVERVCSIAGHLNEASVAETIVGCLGSLANIEVSNDPLLQRRHAIEVGDIRPRDCCCEVAVLHA